MLLEQVLFNMVCLAMRECSGILWASSTNKQNKHSLRPYINKPRIGYSHPVIKDENTSMTVSPRT